jgi:hypothetical protein
MFIAGPCITPAPKIIIFSRIILIFGRTGEFHKPAQKAAAAFFAQVRKAQEDAIARIEKHLG